MCQCLAGTTRRTSSTTQRRFLDFCYWSRRLNENGSPLPASEWTLMTFAAHLSSTLKAESIKVYLAGVRLLHLEDGLANPLNNCLRLESVIRAIKLAQGTTERQRLPVTFAVLERFYSLLDLNKYDDALIWATCCTAFYGFLRFGEFATSSNKFDARVHLELSNAKVVNRSNPTVLFLTIKCSKTDLFRKGHTLQIGAVKVFVHYLHKCGGIRGPLFKHQNDLPLTRTTLTTWLKGLALRTGLEGTFSDHSFRIGATSTAAAVGIPDHLIKTLGRWLSNAYQLYTRTPPRILDAVATRMAHK